MKKRLRKKLHLREFARYGMMTTVMPTPDDPHDTVMRVKAVADRHGLTCWVGCHECILRPSTDAKRPLPSVITNILDACAKGLITGYTMMALVPPDGRAINPQVEQDLLKAFNDPNHPIYIAHPIDLWTGRNYTMAQKKVLQAQGRHASCLC